MRKLMRKATIVTIYDPNPNIGNRLQNYAVQYILESFGFEVDTLSFQPPIFNKKKKMKAFLQKVTNYKLPGDKNYWRLYPKQIKEFERFNRKNIRTQKIKKIEDIKPADYYVLGSDQVWNPQWYDSKLKQQLFMLQFAESDKRICCSPSFGIEKLPKDWEEWFRDNLNMFHSLNVREESGKKIIQELTGQDAQVVVDPTLMLSKKEWNRIATVPRNIDIDKKYILTYFLGGRSEKINEDLKDYAKALDASIYNLFDMDDEQLFMISPSDFLTLIDHATLVVTDSFHACVFSFLYDKPFLVYERIGGKNMMTRLTSFLAKFKLEEKNSDEKIRKNFLNNDYCEGYKILQNEKIKFYNYLNEVLNRRN